MADRILANELDIKVVILAGGLGTRLSEETELKPKPMVEIGGHPILWHIMKHFSHQGFKEFVIPLGYKGETIKRFFVDYTSLDGNLSVDLSKGEVTPLDDHRETWRVHLIDTGLNTNTGGRVKRLQAFLNGPFIVTYGDGVSDVDLRALIEFHRSHGKMATLTAVRPPSRFGGLAFTEEGTVRFTEKPQIGEGWINGGFMMLEPKVLDYVDGDETSLESDVLERISDEDQLMAYKHEGFFQPMDTLRDLRYLRNLWQSGKAPWVTW